LQAIGLNGSKINVAHAMEAVSRVGPNGEGGGASFVAGNTLHSVQRSRYGKRMAQNMTRDVRPARNLVNSAGRFLSAFCKEVDFKTLLSRSGGQETD
jgi:structural maintenance of chromosomes protein 5